MYTWKDALAESYQYLLVFLAFGIIISFLSAWIEQFSKYYDTQYLKVVGINSITSLIGVLVIAFIWVSTWIPREILSEDSRMVIGPIISLIVMYSFKVFALGKYIDVTHISAKWYLSLIHPFLFCILPALGVWYVISLGSSWKN